MCVLCTSWRVVSNPETGIFTIEFNGRLLEDTFTNIDEATEFMKLAREDAAQDFHWADVQDAKDKAKFEKEERDRGH
jgi:hypothetical protein